MKRIFSEQAECGGEVIYMVNNYLYHRFLSSYRYLEKDLEDCKETDNGELILYFKDGTRSIYDGIEDRCRHLPKDSRSMTEEECSAEFAARLRGVMRRKGCTQRELSIRTGFSQSAISKYVTGKTMPSFYSVDRIAKALE